MASSHKPYRLSYVIEDTFDIFIWYKEVLTLTNEPLEIDLLLRLISMVYVACPVTFCDLTSPIVLNLFI